jgi:hypothetical protein
MNSFYEYEYILYIKCFSAYEIYKNIHRKGNYKNNATIKIYKNI